MHLLIDLNGMYSRGARPQLLAARPAPLQAAHLGYGGSTGAPFVDYARAWVDKHTGMQPGPGSHSRSVRHGPGLPSKRSRRKRLEALACNPRRSLIGWLRRRGPRPAVGLARSCCCCRHRTYPRATRPSSRTSATRRRARAATRPPRTSSAAASAAALALTLAALAVTVKQRCAHGAGARGARASGCRRRRAEPSRARDAAARCLPTLGSTSRLTSPRLRGGWRCCAARRARCCGSSSGAAGREGPSFSTPHPWLAPTPRTRY